MLGIDLEKRIEMKTVFGLMLSVCLFFGGCLESRFHYLVSGSEYREYLGFRLYNSSGKEFSGEEWDSKLKTIVLAYLDLERCLGDLDDKLSKKLEALPIVVTHTGDSARLTERPSIGFTDYFFIFRDADSFSANGLKHEWLHNYLFLTTGYGDYAHGSPLFNRCANYGGL